MPFFLKKLYRSQKNDRIWGITFTGFVICLLIMALPAIDRFLLAYFNFSFLFFLGNGPFIGPGKEKFYLACLSLFFVLSFTGYLFFSQKRSILRLLILVIAYGSLGAAVFFPVIPADYVEQIKINNLRAVDDTIFSRKTLMDNLNPKSSLQDYYTVAHQQFQINMDILSKAWQLSNEKQLEAYFYVNLVSHFWGYGNPNRINDTGCVQINEESNFQIIPNPSIYTYLQSNIGCCTDYAYLLKVLLDQAGIKNRRVEVRGHIFNEALFDTRWFTLDATLGMVFHDSWENIQLRSNLGKNSIEVTIFPNQGLVETNNPLYRSNLGHFQLNWLIYAIGKQLPAVAYPDGK